MKCPTCKDVNLVIADRQGIEIDYCPECRGVWLDRGELDKVIERSMSQTPPSRDRESRDREANYDQPRSQDRDDYPSRRRRNKSILGELFDL